VALEVLCNTVKKKQTGVRSLPKKNIHNLSIEGLVEVGLPKSAAKSFHKDVHALPPPSGGPDLRRNSKWSKKSELVALGCSEIDAEALCLARQNGQAKWVCMSPEEIQYYVGIGKVKASIIAGNVKFGLVPDDPPLGFKVWEYGAPKLRKMCLHFVLNDCVERLKGKPDAECWAARIRATEAILEEVKEEEIGHDFDWAFSSGIFCRETEDVVWPVSCINHGVKCVRQADCLGKNPAASQEQQDYFEVFMDIAKKSLETIVTVSEVGGKEAQRFAIMKRFFSPAVFKWLEKELMESELDDDKRRKYVKTKIRAEAFHALCDATDNAGGISPEERIGMMRSTTRYLEHANDVTDFASRVLGISAQTWEGLLAAISNIEGGVRTQMLHRPLSMPRISFRPISNTDMIENRFSLNPNQTAAEWDRNLATQREEHIKRQMPDGQRGYYYPLPGNKVCEDHAVMMPAFCEPPRKKQKRDTHMVKAGGLNVGHNQRGVRVYHGSDNHKECKPIALGADITQWNSEGLSKSHTAKKRCMSRMLS